MKHLFKIVIVILISFFTSTNVFSQDYKKAISNDFITFQNLVITKQFDSSANYIAPELFQLIPRPQFIEMMESSLNNPSMVYEIDSPKLIEVKDKKQIGDKFYAKFKYNYTVRMRFVMGDTISKNEKITQAMLTQAALKTTFGKDNVFYNVETEFYTINSVKDALAISTNGKSDWKFILVEKNQMFTLEKILPKEVIQEIK